MKIFISGGLGLTLMCGFAVAGGAGGPVQPRPVQPSPALPGATGGFTDPVFAPGQVWQIRWADQTTTNMTVPTLSTVQGDIFIYEGRANVNGVMSQTKFWYDPVDSDPEFISLGYSNTESRMCLTLKAGQIKLNEPRAGFYSAEFNDYVRYVQEGQSAGMLSCTLKRIR